MTVFRRITVAAAALAALTVAVSAAAASPGRGEAPGQACREHAPGTQEFRDCVKAAAKGRGNGAEQRAGGPGRTCREAGHEPGTRAFRDCVKAAARARGKRLGVGALRDAARYCRDEQNLQPRTQAFRECVRTVVAERRQLEKAARKGVRRP